MNLVTLCHMGRCTGQSTKSAIAANYDVPNGERFWEKGRFFGRKSDFRLPDKETK